MVDNAGGVTKDTAVVSVTNNIPVIVTIPDTIHTGINTNVDITVSATDDGPGIVYEFDFGNGFVVSDGDTTIKTQHTEEIKQVVVRVKDNDNNSVLDTFYISVRWLYTFYEFPLDVAGSLHARGAYAICKLGNYVYLGGGMQYTSGGPPIKRKDLWRTQDGITWELVNDDLPWGTVSNYCFINSESENAIYAVGPLSGADVFESSNNGVDWDSVGDLSNICTTISTPNGETNTDKLLIISGNATLPTGGNQYLSSPIYRLKSEVTFSGGFSSQYASRIDVSTTILNDTIWFAGGLDANSVKYDDLWIIKPGSHWAEERTVSNKFSGGNGGALFFFNNVIIYAPRDPKEIWFSKDRGRNWDILNISVPWHLDATQIVDGFTLNSKMMFFSVVGVYVSDNCP